VKASDNEFPSVLLDEQASAPTTPASGFWRLYAKSTGLFIVDDAGGETGPFGTGGGGGIAEGTSFPGSPTADDLFYRTDRNIIYFYDGTRWLSIHQFTMQITTRSELGSGLTATTTLGYAPTRGASGDMYIEDLRVSCFAIAALTGSNFFTVDLDKRTTANAATVVGSIVMNSQTISTWANYVDNVNEVVDGATYVTFALTATETGSANIFMSVEITYRLVG
jgi:hypothetical protein